MIDRERLKALLIERAKEAGLFSDTPEFAKHIEAEVVDHLTDDKSDHETDLTIQINLIRQHNVMLDREPYKDYPYDKQSLQSIEATIVQAKSIQAAEAKVEAK